jgi:2-methylcitrate dehydratase
MVGLCIIDTPNFWGGRIMHRREFLAMTGGAAGVGWMGAAAAESKAADGAAPAVPEATPSSQRKPQSSVEQRLADYASGIRYDDMPTSTVQAIKRLLIDTLACGYGAVGAPPPSIAEKVFRNTYVTRESASILANPRLIGTEGATLVNGVLIRYLDLNDIYVGKEPCHPSELIPAAIAACEEAGRGGRDLIEAIAVGYEAIIRLNDALSFSERGFYSTSAAGFVVPLVAGKAWRTPVDRVVQAMGIAGPSQLSLLAVTRGELSMMKAWCCPHTAMDAIFAMRLAAEGFTGAPGALDWFAANVKPSQADVGIDLDSQRYFLEKVGLKRFPVQFEIQSVAEAGVNLHRLAGERIGRISEVVVETYPAIKARVADAPKFAPKNRETADHSLPIAAAMALLDGDVTSRQFADGRWRASDVLALAGKIEVKVSDSLVAKLPKGRGASMEVFFDDGQSVKDIVEIPEGDAERPLSRAALEHKFAQFAEPVLGEARARSVMSLVDDLEHVSDVRTLTAALRGAPA